MIIKEFKKEDLREVTDLYISIFTQEPWNDVYESYEQVELFNKSFISDGAYLSYIAIYNGELVGICFGMKKPWIEGMEYYIDQFGIKIEFQGKGLGSTFLSLIEKEIQTIGLHSMMLNTEEGYASEAFYKKNGFKRIDNLIVLGK